MMHLNFALRTALFAASYTAAAHTLLALLMCRGGDLQN